MKSPMLAVLDRQTPSAPSPTVVARLIPAE
jgi:hypothetical protein